MAGNQKIYTPRNHHAEQCAVPQDQPLDPAVEQIRKRLMRLMIVSVSITLILILSVLFGVIYKIAAPRPDTKQVNPSSFQGKDSETTHHTLSLPRGTQILSQDLSEHNIALKVRTPEGKTQLMIYNYYTGALIAIFSVETTHGTPTEPPR
ncbi:hypothetical protein [Bartonella sp. CB178]|uniref:hypothetical protein n=1 Tax=Bartonella sp. CB178 TaxID=3112255 RepID=UPI00300DE0CA